ncbi:MAG TPA: DegV family protein [Anaerolineales bacterium]|nr:DegV family protein [Anaerolineales bacterium]
MNKSIGLVTDSTADIPEDQVRAEGVEIVPATIVVEGQPYQDGVGLTRPEFYRLLPDLAHPASTAAPAPSAFEAAYDRMLASGVGRVLSIHLSRRLSGLYGIAVQAARRFGDRVSVVDSGQVSLGLGFQVLEAARAIRRGASWEAVQQAVASAGRRIRTIAMIEQLDYARRSGRIDWLRSSIGNLLHVRLLLEIADGLVRRLGQVRTRHRAIDELFTIAASWGPVQRLGVVHAVAEEDARALASRLAVSVEEPPLVVDVTTVIGTHVGPGSVGVIGLLR